MSTHFLVYWKPSTADINLNQGGLLNHAASDQFVRIGIGDVLWIVTVRKGMLSLLGRLVVGQITNLTKAKRLLGMHKLWEANYHAIAANETAHPIEEMSIAHVAERLRFVSASGNDRLAVTDGRVNPQQLQTMRVLEPSSADLLEAVLKRRHLAEREFQQSPARAASTRALKGTKAACDDRADVFDTLRRLQDAGRKSNDLIQDKYRDQETPGEILEGLCYVISECLFHQFPGMFTPYRISWGNGRTHWFLQFQSGEILDGINPQGGAFCDAKDYRQARRAAFFTKAPSKRARVLSKRAGLSFPQNAPSRIRTGK